ncbi:hypothetical protein ACQ4M4_25495 [Leptolyngbya sp. AN02str]|uniref:hypothetical protein n=1 Tax=Leptolyngbya sp. AN02str TaxID=3423363 RepID=UPI003D317C85
MATNPEPQPTPQNAPVAEAPLIEPSPTSTPPIPTEQSIEPVVQQTAYQEAFDLTTSAQTFAENAVSADDWNVVTTQFEQAIKLLEGVPAQDVNYAAAQDSLKRSSYALSFAQKQELPPSDPFPEAIKAAMNAANLTQTASFTSEWRQIVEQWEAAIQHLANVPKSSPNYETAQAKIAEYSKNQTYAQERIKALTASSTTTTSTGQSKGSIAPARSPRSGSCQCPYDYDSRGRSCGERSAYSRPGGDAPMCYIRVGVSQ